jgi:ParB-like chromosome segregation protein Spo0J
MNKAVTGLHPINEIFPMMTGAEMEDLAEDIKATRLIDPIALDKNGRLLDGKCRLQACELAGVEPKFKTFEGFDSAFPGSRLPYEEQCERLIILLNVKRQSLSKSQKAIAEALGAERCPDAYWARRVIPEARAVARHRDLADQVVAGMMSLSMAHESVLERERRAALEAEAAVKNRERLERLRKEAPFLAHQVEEGTLTLYQAQTELQAPVLAEHADAIRSTGKRMIADAIEIGRRLSVCKEMLSHGGWLPWLEREFQWSERTARNFMQLHELSLKSANIADLDLPTSAVYLLAAPSTPESARTDVLTRAEAGERFSVGDVRRLINQGRPDRPARDRFADLRELVAKMSRELPEDPLVGQLQALLG